MKINAHILSSFINPWGIIPEAVSAWLPLIANILKGNVQFASSTDEDKELTITNTYIVHPTDTGIGLLSVSSGNKNSIPENSVVKINYSGVVTKYRQECSSTPSALEIERILKDLDRNENVKSIIIHVDSPGGESYAGQRLARAVSSFSKPIDVLIDDLCASAAYNMACCADNIYANSAQARIGSIGTYTTLVDYSEYLQKEGIKLIEVYATPSTQKNEEFREALKGNTKPLQKIIDEVQGVFAENVTVGRGSKLIGKEWNTGKLFNAVEAEKIGLIDGIMSIEELYQKHFDI